MKKSNKIIIGTSLVLGFVVILLISVQIRLVPNGYHGRESENALKLSTQYSNREIINSILDSKQEQFDQQEYFSESYIPSIQATYHALSVLKAIDRLNSVNQSKIINYIMSHLDPETGIFLDEYALRYLDTDFSLDYYPLSTLLEVNCYALLSLYILNQEHLVNTQYFVDYIWSCYQSISSGFAGQDTDQDIHPYFLTATLDNTFYALKTLDVYMDSWLGYETHRDELIVYINDLQSQGSGGFYNDEDLAFDSLDENEPSLFSSYYGIKSLQIFGMEGTMNVEKFNEYLEFLYDEISNSFEISKYPWIPGYANIVASSIALELSDITGFQSMERSGVISFILNHMNELGGWDGSTEIPYHELIDTFQIVRSLEETGEIVRLSESEKDTLANFIGSYKQFEGFSLLSRDYMSVRHLHSVVSSFKLYDRLPDLDIFGLYDIIEDCCRYLGIDETFGVYDCTNLVDYYTALRSWPIEYYNHGTGDNSERGEIIVRQEIGFKALDTLDKLFKLNDFASYHDLEKILNDTINSQFINAWEEPNYGGFTGSASDGSLPSSVKNKLVSMENSFYAIRIMDLIGNLTELDFDPNALSTYIIRNTIETPDILYIDTPESDETESILKDTYQGIYILKTIDAFSLDKSKVKEFILNQINYSNIKNVYYSYKLSELLNLNIIFDVNLVHLLVQNNFNQAEQEFFLSTDRSKIDQDILSWICEMAKSDNVRINPVFSDSVSLGGYNIITVDLCNMILNDFGIYTTVKLESDQLGVILFDYVENSTYQTTVFIPIEADNYPEVRGNITVYDGARRVSSHPISFNTTYGRILEFGFIESTSGIRFSLNGSHVYDSGIQPLFGTIIFARVYLNGQELGVHTFDSRSDQTRSEYWFEYIPTESGEYYFEIYLEDGFSQVPSQVGNTTFIFNSDEYGNPEKTVQDPQIESIWIPLSLIGLPIGIVVVYTRFRKFRQK